MDVDEVDNEEDNLEFIGEIYIPLALNKKSIESNSNIKDKNFSMKGGTDRDRDLLFLLFNKGIRDTLGKRRDTYMGGINHKHEDEGPAKEARDQLKACLREALRRNYETVTVYINVTQTGLYIEFYRFRINGAPSTTMTPFYLSIHFRPFQLNTQHDRFERNTVHRQPTQTPHRSNQRANFRVDAIINGVTHDPNSDYISQAQTRTTGSNRALLLGEESHLTFNFVPPSGGAAAQNAAMMRCLKETLFPDNSYIYVTQRDLTNYMDTAGGRRLKYKKTKKTKRPKKSKKTRKTRKTRKTKKTKGKTKK